MRRLLKLVAGCILMLPAMAVLVGVLIILITPLTHMYVTGSSMEPVIEKGEYILVWEMSGPFASGDVIVFHTQPGCDAKYGVMAHVFQGYNEDGTLRTQGAALDGPDNCDIYENDVIGRVIDIPVFKLSWLDPLLVGSILLIVLWWIFRLRSAPNSPSNPV